jgi:hypothetical protein
MDGLVRVRVEQMGFFLRVMLFSSALFSYYIDNSSKSSRIQSKHSTCTNEKETCV